MTRDDSHVLSRDERLAELILQYIDAVEAGHPVDRLEFISTNPDFREELQQFFVSRDEVERVAAPLRNAAGCERVWNFNATLFQSEHARVPQAAWGTIQHQDPLGQLGEFRLVREIGRGGMGVVYEAEQLSLKRRVALKVLPFAAAIDERHVLRFKNEALASGMLNHPNIVPVYSVGNERGVHFYSMQLIEGQSLAALIAGLRHQAITTDDRDAAAADPVQVSPDRKGEDRTGDATAPWLVQTAIESACHRDTAVQFQQNVPSQHTKRDGRYFRTAARLMLQAAEALHYAHESGIVHRDIKPANLLLDLSGQLRITDFGLAQFHSEIALTRTGDTPGTLRYMSPEQAAGKRAIVDHRTDVYSLGATFYELLSLSPIFPANDAPELLSQIFEMQPLALRKLDTSIPVELETIVLKATGKSPDDRYQTAGGLAADLRRYLDNQPILARRPSLLDHARKWARRHPLGVIASLVVLAIVSGISITAFILIDGAYHRERLRADEAEAQFQLARRSVDELVRVSEEELAFNPNAEALRRRLLTSVLAYYQEFIEQRRGDPRAQASLAEASNRVERILEGLRALRAAGQIKLLNQPAVANELRLGEAQQATAQELLDQVEKLWQETFRDLGKSSAAESDRRFIKQSRLNEAGLKATLSPEQLRRLGQLDLQADVAAAFREPEVSDRLKLTDSQRDQIKTIEQQEMAQWRNARHKDKVSNSVDKNGGAKPALSKNERILEVLSAEQAIIWRELTGTPLSDLHR